MLPTLQLADAFKGYTYDQDKLMTPEETVRRVRERLAAETGLPLELSADPVEAMQSLRPFAGLSASVRNLALELNRIANDLRLLASGPRRGLVSRGPRSSFRPRSPAGHVPRPGRLLPVSERWLLRYRDKWA